MNFSASVGLLLRILAIFCSLLESVMGSVNYIFIVMSKIKKGFFSEHNLKMGNIIKIAR